MAVLSYREVVGRGFQHKFGDAPTADRRYVVTLDDPNTPTQQVLDAVNIKHGDSHPEYSYLRCTEGTVAENDPDAFHASVSYRYELPAIAGNVGFDPNPLARPDVWSFSTGGSQVPALTYWHPGEGGIDEQRPLVNSAKEYFEGMTTEEAEVRVSISGNRAAFPLTVAAGVTNSVNKDGFLGGGQYTWKCSGISAQQTSEVVNGVELNFWAISVELTYRESGWPLLIPDIGWNYIDPTDNKKYAVYVRDPWGVKIAASAPQPLNETGGLKFPDSSGMPTILIRRLNKAVNFSLLFGTPTFPVI